MVYFEVLPVSAFSVDGALRIIVDGVVDLFNNGWLVDLLVVVKLVDGLLSSGWLVYLLVVVELVDGLLSGGWLVNLPVVVELVDGLLSGGWLVDLLVVVELVDGLLSNGWLANENIRLLLTPVLLVAGCCGVVDRLVYGCTLIDWPFSVEVVDTVEIILVTGLAVVNAAKQK